MWILSATFIFWATLVIPLISLGTLAAMRLCRSVPGRSLCQQAFFAQLLAQGILTAGAVSTGSEAWVASGTTLSALTLCATFDFGGESRRAAAF